jgi:uncharacterized membrane protein YkvA (DUF1232 family)
MDAVGPLIVAIVMLLVVWALMIISVWRAAPSRATVIDVVRLLPDLVRLAARLARHPTTPRSSRLALAGLAVWIASPIDLIPEFVPVIGPLDDIVVAAIVPRLVAVGSAWTPCARIGRGAQMGSTSSCDSWGLGRRKRPSRAGRNRTVSTSFPRHPGARRTHPSRMPSSSA